jgi:hypothetical protein
MPANKGHTLARNCFRGMARSHEEQTAQPTEESYNGETIPSPAQDASLPVSPDSSKTTCWSALPAGKPKASR